MSHSLQSSTLRILKLVMAHYLIGKFQLKKKNNQLQIKTKRFQITCLVNTFFKSEEKGELSF